MTFLEWSIDPMYLAGLKTFVSIYLPPHPTVSQHVRKEGNVIKVENWHKYILNYCNSNYCK
jgi:hypothetical protein